MCRCECGLRVFTQKPITLPCHRCGRTIDCNGGSSPLVDTCNDPLPQSQWPAWARFIKRLARPTEAGVGDTVQRIAAEFGGELFKRFVQRVGMPCGCTERQADWNRRYPYHGGDDGSLEGREASP